MARNRFFGLTNRVLLLVAALLLVVSYLSMVVNPAKLWLMSLAGLMFVPFLLLNIFLLVWAFMRRSKAFVIPLLAIIPAVFFIHTNLVIRDHFCRCYFYPVFHFLWFTFFKTSKVHPHRMEI